MKILVTGATGLVGGAIAKQLLAKGHHVLALCRRLPPQPRVTLDQGMIEWVEGDLLDIVRLQQLISDGVQQVVHAAALVSFIPRDRPEMMTVNVEGTANVVNVCLAVGVQKLCHISSVAALGRPAPKKGEPIEGRITEAQRWEESPLNSAYAKSKYMAELEVWRGIAEGLPAVILNPSVVLGEGDWSRSSTQLFKYVYSQKPFYTDGWVNYVDVQDVAEIALKLLDSEIHSERFILNAGTVPYRALFEQMAHFFDKKPPAWRLSGPVVAVLWRIEALRSVLLGSRPLITRETALSASHHFTYPSDKLLQAFDIRYRTLDETLARVCESLKSSI